MSSPPGLRSNSRYIPADGLRSTGFVRSRFLGGDALDFEIRIIAKNGIVKHCNAKGVVERDQDGVDYAFETFADITGHRQAKADWTNTAIIWRQWWRSARRNWRAPTCPLDGCCKNKKPSCNPVMGIIAKGGS